MDSWDATMTGTGGAVWLAQDIAFDDVVGLGRGWVMSLFITWNNRFGLTRLQNLPTECSYVWYQVCTIIIHSDMALGTSIHPLVQIGTRFRFDTRWLVAIVGPRPVPTVHLPNFQSSRVWGGLYGPRPSVSSFYYSSSCCCCGCGWSVVLATDNPVHSTRYRPRVDACFVCWAMRTTLVMV